MLNDGIVTIKSRVELQPDYISEEEVYFQELSDKLAEEEIAMKEVQKAKLMLKEYTDKETIKAAQTALNAAGYDCGTPDGIAGKGTVGAITQYQTDKGLNITGTVTHELLISLGVIAE